MLIYLQWILRLLTRLYLQKWYWILLVIKPIYSILRHIHTWLVLISSSISQKVHQFRTLSLNYFIIHFQVVFSFNKNDKRSHLRWLEENLYWERPTPCSYNNVGELLELRSRFIFDWWNYGSYKLIIWQVFISLGAVIICKPWIQKFLAPETDFDWYYEQQSKNKPKQFESLLLFETHDELKNRESG